MATKHEAHSYVQVEKHQQLPFPMRPSMSMTPNSPFKIFSTELLNQTNASSQTNNDFAFPQRSRRITA